MIQYRVFTSVDDKVYDFFIEYLDCDGELFKKAMKKLTMSKQYIKQFMDEFEHNQYPVVILTARWDQSTGLFKISKIDKDLLVPSFGKFLSTNLGGNVYKIIGEYEHYEQLVADYFDLFLGST